MNKQNVSLRLQYAVVRRFVQFYSGGSVAISSDGKRLFSTHDNVIKVLDTDSGDVRLTVGDENSDSVITCFCLSVDEATLIVAHENLLLRLWQLSNEATSIVKTWRVGGRGPIQRMVRGCGARSHLFVTGASDGSVKLWDLQLNTCVGSVQSDRGLTTSLCFLPGDHVSVVCGTDTGAIWLWQPYGGTSVVDLAYHSAAVTALAVSGPTLYSASRDMTIALWNLERLELTRTIPVYDALECLLLLRDSEGLSNSALVVAGEKGILKQIDVSTGKVTFQSLPMRSRIIQAHFCQAIFSYLVVTEDQGFHFLQCDGLDAQKHLMGNNSIVNDAAFVSDDLLAVAVNSPDIRLYSVASGDCQLLSGHSDMVLCVAVPRWSSSVFLSSSKDKTFRLWRIFGATDVRCICMATGHTASVTVVRWSNLKPEFCVSASEDMTVKLFSLKREWLEKPMETADPVTLSSMLTQVAHAKGISCLAVSPNDKLLATGSMDKSVKIWNVKAVGRLQFAGEIGSHKRGIWDVQFSPVDQIVATASGDLTVKLFSLSDLSCLRTFEGHGTAVLRVLFTPSGGHLISSDTSGLLKLWDPKTGLCINTYDAHEGKIWALCVNSDGRRLTSGGEDAALLVWNDVTAEKLTEVEKKRQQAVQRDQKLSNLIQQGHYVQALRLSVKMRRPKSAHDVLQRMIYREDGMNLTQNELSHFSLEEFQTLLTFAVEWNTNSRTYLIGQLVLSVLLKKYTFDELLKWPNAATTIRHLIPYTKRHFERLSQYREKLALLTFIVNSTLPVNSLSISDSLIAVDKDACHNGTE